jgi:hypothetical protein
MEVKDISNEQTERSRASAVSTGVLRSSDNQYEHALKGFQGGKSCAFTGPLE